MRFRTSIRSIWFVALLSLGVIIGCGTTDSKSASNGGETDGSSDKEMSTSEEEKEKKEMMGSDEAQYDKIVYRVNAGASESFETDSGEKWLADHLNWKEDKKWGATGGNTVFRGELNIVGAKHDEIYRYERWGVPGYQFSVPKGTYEVRLHFSENYHGVNAEGTRLFSVHIEGRPILERFDVFREAGGRNTAVIRIIEGVKVKDGTLNIDFKWDVHQPFINGIEVIRTG